MKLTHPLAQAGGRGASLMYIMWRELIVMHVALQTAEYLIRHMVLIVVLEFFEEVLPH